MEYFSLPSLISDADLITDCLNDHKIINVLRSHLQETLKKEVGCLNPILI